MYKNPYAMGYLGVESAYNLLNDIPLKNKKVNTETICATRENIFMMTNIKKLCSLLNKIVENYTKKVKNLIGIYTSSCYNNLIND